MTDHVGTNDNTLIARLEQLMQIWLKLSPIDRKISLIAARHWSVRNASGGGKHNVRVTQGLHKGPIEEIHSQDVEMALAQTAVVMQPVRTKPPYSRGKRLLAI